MIKKLENIRLSEGSSQPIISFKEKIQQEGYKVSSVTPTEQNVNKKNF
jgi:hypothetical protein